MWQLWVTAQSLSTRPSELLAIDDPYAAYCLDTAVTEFGLTIQGELDNILNSDKKHPERLAEAHLRRRLGLAPQFRAPPRTVTSGAGGGSARL